jgi:hypothetical protein
LGEVVHEMLVKERVMRQKRREKKAKRKMQSGEVMKRRDI